MDGYPVRSAGVCLLLLVLALPGAPAALAKSAQDSTVVPGRRIGSWRLGIPMAQLLREHGRAATGRSLLSLYVPRLKWHLLDHSGLAAAALSDGKVTFLAVDRRDLFTPERVGIWTSRHAVRAAYGKPELDHDMLVQGREVTVLIYDRLGLALFLDDNVVRMMVVFQPGRGPHLFSMCGT